MKIIQMLLLFSMGFPLFISCNDDKKEDHIIFSTTALRQTQWVGTLNESYIASMDVPVSSIIKVGIFFTSESEARYSLKWETMDQPLEATLKYTISDKILTIESNGTELTGKWLLIQFDKDKMILKKGTGGDNAYKGILTLRKEF